MDVAKTANQLLGQGKNPTIEQIRRLLGSGSSTTLSQHLKRWKESQGPSQQLASKENLPEELIALMKGLWERVISQADEKIAKIDSDFQSRATGLDTELHKYKTNNQRWQQLHNQWLQEKTQLSKKKSAAERMVQQGQQELTTLAQKQELLLQQLQEKQDHLKELQRLHRQTQGNLEYLQESARTQRLMEQQRADKERQSLQKQAQEFKEFNHEQKAQLKKLETQLKKLESQHAAALLKADNYKNRCQEAEEKHSAQHKRLIELQTEPRLFSSQLTQSNQQLQVVLEKNKHKEEEKLEFIKRIAHLEERLKIEEKV